MAQPRPVLPSQPRRRSLERLEAEIAEAEADRGRWAGRAAGLRSRRLDDRAELALVRIAEDRPDGLDRSRAVLLEGDAGGDEPEPEAGRHGGRHAHAGRAAGRRRPGRDDRQGRDVLRHLRAGARRGERDARRLRGLLHLEQEAVADLRVRRDRLRWHL